MLSVLALLLLGAVAAAGSGVGIGTATLRRNPASVTFTIAVTLFGVFAAGCLIWVFSLSVLGHRGSRARAGASERSRRLAAALPVLVLLVLVLFVAARRHPRLPSVRQGAPAAGAHTAAHSALSFVPGASLWTLAVVVAVFALLLLRRRILRWRHHRPFGHPAGATAVSPGRRTRPVLSPVHSPRCGYRIPRRSQTRGGRWSPPTWQ